MDTLHYYRAVWVVDFEFHAPPGERPAPLCVVARELRTGRLARVWLDGDAPADPPYGTGPDCLFVAYYASAELTCHMAHDWPMPARILDLYAEFRNLTSGLPVPCGNSLLGALAYYGLDGLAAAEKEACQQLAIRGGPFTEAERAGLVDYCQTDVDALARLLPAMLPRIDLPRALLRGRYMAAAARMEWAGVPLDTAALARLREHWGRIKGRLIAAVNAEYGVYLPAERRTLDPDTALGAAVLREAGEWGIDPHRLADAVDVVWAAERAAGAEVEAARRAARRATGLTARRIDAWEDAGRDPIDYPGLDVTARQLAGVYPALGIGVGYDPDAPDADYGGHLWEVLRDRAEKPKPKHAPDILRRAAELVAGCPAGAVELAGPLRFSAERWAAYLTRRSIPWPRLPSGALALDDDTFREMARAYPDDVGPIRELRHAISQMRLHGLAVGADGRNRCLLSAFASRTGRNQPSNSRFTFGPAVWLRSLIRPAPGMAVAYVDWSGQEYGIAAALSGDPAMQADYASGDPYLAFGRRIGAVSADATKRTHARQREQLKTCCGLGAMYGAGPQTVAACLGVPEWQARDWLRAHREVYRVYWRWSDAVLDQAMLTGQLQTVFGWTVRVGPDTRPNSLRNFPMQAHGAEMMRLACCLATERGITVCCPVHDALLVEGPAADISDVVAETQRAMREASELVLPGFPLRTDAKIVCHPDRYTDDRGRRMWDTVWSILDAETGQDTSPPAGATLRPFFGGAVSPPYPQMTGV